MKYLYFSNAGDEDAVNDIACYPVSSFRGFAISAADTVSLGLYFDRIVEGIGAGEDEPFDLVDLVITAGKAKDVCNAIVREINKGGGEDFITVADDKNSVYLTDLVSSVAAITPGT